MPSLKIDKVIVANRQALISKYGAVALPDIESAIARLTAANALRMIVTELVYIDDAVACKRFNTTPVINALDEAGAKRVVDAIAAVATPDYIVLLDGPDIIPHITLSMISGLVDGDIDIPSDLPYACGAPFSVDAADFMAVTRVVGRMPMGRGNSNAADLISTIDFSVQHTSRPAAAFNSHFAISADVWKTSTQLNMSTLFGATGALKTSPTAGHTAIDPMLRAMTHFVNCHGATNDPRFYGQAGDTYPVAMDSTKVAPHISVGTVAAAECCFGAELYDPALLQAGGDPMSVVYLRGGAAAFVGSTNTAYGPAASNAQADLMVQYFLQQIFKGASTGRAFLQARQRFVMSQKMADPTNLKTLAQFVLYSDPSVLPVASAPPPASATLGAVDAIAGGTQAKTPPPDINPKGAREARRLSLQNEGLAIASGATRIGKALVQGAPAPAVLRTLAQMRGFAAPITLFEVKGGASLTRATKALGKRQRVAMMVDRKKIRDPSAGEHVAVRVLVAYMLDDDIVGINETMSR